MKKLILLLAIITIPWMVNAQISNPNNFQFKSEFEFINSNYIDDAFAKYINKILKETIGGDNDLRTDAQKLLPNVSDTINSQTKYYKKYPILSSIFLPQSLCNIPWYFHKQADGTISASLNFVDFGLKVNPYINESMACVQIIDAIQSIIDIIIPFCDVEGKGTISKFGVSTPYLPQGDSYSSAKNTQAVCIYFPLSVMKKYNDGEITKKEYLSKLIAYHRTNKTNFRKISLVE